LNACLLAVLLSNLVFLFSVPTASDRYVVSESPGTQTTPEPPGHSHQMSIVEVVVGSIQLPPPDSKSRRTLCESKIGIQHDPIHAIIGAVHEIRVHPAQSIWHTRSMLANSISCCSLLNSVFATRGTVTTWQSASDILPVHLENLRF